LFSLQGPAASDIAWIGAGSSDAFLHMGIHCWDMAAGVLIVTEAGGCVLNPNGTEFNLMGRQIVAAASEELAKEIVSKIMIFDVAPEFSEHCPI
jgi:myo-inositol-1(or 4)-monophosphatase